MGQSQDKPELPPQPKTQPYDPVLLWDRKLSGKQCQLIDFAAFAGSLPNLVDRMSESMIELRGQGIAAPQIGIFVQAAMVVINGQHFPIFNPTILDSKGDSFDWEGCLSLPGANSHYVSIDNKVRVSRSTWIKVDYQDIDGSHVVREYENHAARVMQHEIDHLSGVFIIDRIGNIFRDAAINKMRRYIKGVVRGRIPQ